MEENTAGREGFKRSAPPTLGALYSGRDLALCSTEDARALVAFSDASSLQVLPLSLLKGSRRLTLHCAAAKDSERLRDRLRFTSGMEVSLTVVTPEVLEEGIVRAYLGSDARLTRSITEISEKRALSEAQEAVPAKPQPRSDATQFLSALLEYGAARGASDLHLCPVRHGAVVKIRIDGELLSQEAQPYPSTLHEQVISRLKVLAGLDVTCRRLPQDGSFSFDVGGKDRSARLSTLPAVYGESAVVRFLASETIPQVSLLGLEPITAGILKSAIRQTQGIIFFTGPTGSGKTTTMYAIAAELKTSGRNVITVEDPVESPLPGIVQVGVHEQQGLSYPRAIRSVLRHDPDVILIGEMRDPESTRIGLEAAATGHLTLSSLHVGSPLLAFERLATLGMPRERAVPILSLVVTQRLLPKLCPRCKTRDSVASERFGFPVYRGAGCGACGESGYAGRVVCTETLNLCSEGAKEACLAYTTRTELLKHLPRDAFIPWSTSLHFLLEQGVISARQLDTFIEREK
jgi:type II secretory ATPase GspE/PulE/Tfp pilus assembly ATPase PilB-like protein